MAQRATSLGPKPSLLFLFRLCFFFGPPRLALNPPYLFVLICFCLFTCLFCLLKIKRKMLSSPQEQDIFAGLFSVCLAFFLSSSFQFFLVSLLLSFFLSFFLSFSIYYCLSLLPSLPCFLAYLSCFSCLLEQQQIIKRDNLTLKRDMK